MNYCNFVCLKLKCACHWLCVNQIASPKSLHSCSIVLPLVPWSMPPTHPWSLWPRLNWPDICRSAFNNAVWSALIVPIARCSLQAVSFAPPVIELSTESHYRFITVSTTTFLFGSNLAKIGFITDFLYSDCIMIWNIGKAIIFGFWRSVIAIIWVRSCLRLKKCRFSCQGLPCRRSYFHLSRSAYAVSSWHPVYTSCL